MLIFHRAICLLLLFLVFTCSLLDTNPKKEGNDQSEYTAQLNRIFNGSFFDYFQNHNQALDIIDALTQDGLLQKNPATLIHFDSHSDMYRMSRSEDKYSDNYGQGYADYINSLMLEGKVEEIYWVIPDESRTPENQKFFWNPETGTDEYYVMFNGPNTQTFYIDDRINDILFDKPDDYSVNPAWYRTVTFHKVVLDELQLEHNDRTVIIDIDADYFSNSGFDTANEMVVNYNKHNITRFLSTLENRGIKPILTMGSMSPDYTQEKDLLTLERFFQDIGACTHKGDYLIGYKHRDKYGDTIVGSNIRRQSKDLYQGIYEMSYFDLRTNTPDSLTFINDTNAEYKKVTMGIQKLLGISEQKTATLLMDWDNEDGYGDSIVHYYQIEKNVQNSNGNQTHLSKNPGNSLYYRANLKKHKFISKREYLNQKE